MADDHRGGGVKGTPSPAMILRVRELDRWFPPKGPCDLCDHPDVRHRLWDVILRCARARMTVREIARDLGFPAAAIRAVLRIRPYTRGRKTTT